MTTEQTDKRKELEEALGLFNLTEETLKQMTLADLEKQYQEKLTLLNKDLANTPQNSVNISDHIKKLNQAHETLQPLTKNKNTTVLIHSHNDPRKSSFYQSTPGNRENILQAYRDFVAKKYPDRTDQFKPHTISNLKELENSDFYKDKSPQEKKEIEGALKSGASITVLTFDNDKDAQEFIQQMIDKGWIKNPDNSLDNDDEEDTKLMQTSTAPSPFRTRLVRG